VINRLSHCTAPTTGVLNKHPHHYSGTLAKCLPGHSHDPYTWPTQPTTYKSTVCLSTVNESWELNIRVSFAFNHKYGQSKGNRQVADVCTSALFPLCGKYEQGLDKISLRIKNVSFPKITQSHPQATHAISYTNCEVRNPVAVRSLI